MAMEADIVMFQRRIQRPVGLAPKRLMGSGRMHGLTPNSAASRGIM